MRKKEKERGRDGEKGHRINKHQHQPDDGSEASGDIRPASLNLFWKCPFSAIFFLHQRFSNATFIFSLIYIDFTIHIKFIDFLQISHIHYHLPIHHSDSLM